MCTAAWGVYRRSGRGGREDVFRGDLIVTLAIVGAAASLLPTPKSPFINPLFKGSFFSVNNVPHMNVHYVIELLIIVWLLDKTIYYTHASVLDDDDTTQYTPSSPDLS